MKPVHHATQTKAAQNGLQIDPSQEEGYVVRYHKDYADGNLRVLASDEDPKVALSRAIGLAKMEIEAGMAPKKLMAVAADTSKKAAKPKPEPKPKDPKDPEAEGDEDEDEDEKKLGGSIVKGHYKNEYAARGDATCCGDDMSQILKDALTTEEKDGKKTKVVLDMTAVRELASQHGWTEKVDKTWAHLNPGQIRMNLGNMLRKKMRDDGFVMVFKTKVVDENVDPEDLEDE